MTSARETLLAALGVLAAAVAVGVAVGLAPASALGPASSVDATLGTGVLGLGLLAYAFHRRRSSGEGRDDPLLEDDESDGRDAPGERVDAALDRIAADSSGRANTDARAVVRERVRLTAERAYAQGAGADDVDAAEAVAAGEWTDDRVAAAFLGDDRAPRLPLRERLRGWLHPGRAFERRARRAAHAAHALAVEVSQ